MRDDLKASATQVPYREQARDWSDAKGIILLSSGTSLQRNIAGLPRSPPLSRLALKLHLELPLSTNFITACEAAAVQVNEVAYVAPLIVLADRVISPWKPQIFTDLMESDFAELAALGVEIILLGTGAVQKFPHPRLTRALIEKRIGLEVMNTGAACRTYNILVAEGRSVAAALLP